MNYLRRISRALTGDTQVRITGSDRGPYRLGEVMYLHQGGTLLGTLDLGPISRETTHVHLENFVPASAVASEKRRVGRLITLEVLSFLTRSHKPLAKATFTLKRPLKGTYCAHTIADHRASTLAHIGATNITVTKATQPDHDIFVVRAEWENTEPNRRLLAEELAEARAEMADLPIGHKRARRVRP